MNMFETIVTLNLLLFNSQNNQNNCELRGYSDKCFITGQFLNLLKSRVIKPLSVSDISDSICPEKRDLYFKKGRTRPPDLPTVRSLRSRKNWGNLAGNVVEKYFAETYSQLCGIPPAKSYEDVISKSKELDGNFRESNKNLLHKLKELDDDKLNDTEWLLNLLVQSCRMQIAFRAIHARFRDKSKKISEKNLAMGTCELRPKPHEIGISSPSTPDFLIEDFNVIGDIKTGIDGFQERYLLTCAGYALAFENFKGKESRADVGIIHYLRSRSTPQAKLVSLPQTYIFLIDDDVRSFFIRRRNEAYRIVSEEQPPNFPNDVKNCNYCQFLEYCKKKGLQT